MLWYLRPFYIVLEVSSAGEFKNFSMFRWLLLLFFKFFLFFFFVCFFFCSFFFCFFVPRGKSFVLFCFLFFFNFKISCWNVFFIPGVHSRVRGSPMWCLKGFLRRGYQCGV